MQKIILIISFFIFSFNVFSEEIIRATVVPLQRRILMLHLQVIANLLLKL